MIRRRSVLIQPSSRIVRSALATPAREDAVQRAALRQDGRLQRESDGSEVIVRSTIARAQSFGLRVIADGIEDEVQARRLRALDCEYGQGYLLSRPLRRKDAEVLLATWSPERAGACGAGMGLEASL